jgi:predicted aspartyl protease
VDDLGKVPEAYLDQIQVYREKYDNLSEQDKSQALQRERDQMQRQEQQMLLRLNEQLQEIQAAEDEEKRRKAESAKQKLMETRVIVEGDRILVPVTMVNNGVELTVNLVLDTGASKIVLHRDVADQLNIIALSKGFAQVAGGQNIYVETGQVNYFKVGPFNMEKATVLIMAHEGPSVSYSGLLGMNFLKNVQYTIDYQNQLIRWQPPQIEE